jgi:hypothetical protein
VVCAGLPCPALFGGIQFPAHISLLDRFQQVRLVAKSQHCDREGETGLVRVVTVNLPLIPSVTSSWIACPAVPPISIRVIPTSVAMISSGTKKSWPFYLKEAGSECQQPSGKRLQKQLWAAFARRLDNLDAHNIVSS